MWYYKVVNKFMLVNGEKKFIVKIYKQNRFGRYQFAEDENGETYDLKDCKKIHGETRQEKIMKEIKFRAKRPDLFKKEGK